MDDSYRQAFSTQISTEPVCTKAPCFHKSLVDQRNIREGKTVHIEASLEPQGDSTMKVEWFKDGQQLDASSRITTLYNYGYVALTIIKFEPRDAGTYTCVATNALGSDQTSAFITHQAPTQIIKKFIPEQSIKSDHPQPTSSDDEYWQNYQQLEDSSFYRRDDEEEMDIQIKPKFTSPLSGPKELMEGQNAHFETRLEPIGDPKLSVQWYRNDVPIISGHRFKTYFNFGYIALDVSPVYREDSGTFTIKAVNELGETCLSHELKVCLPSDMYCPPDIDWTSVKKRRVSFNVEDEKVSKTPRFQRGLSIDMSKQQAPVFTRPLKNTQTIEKNRVHLEARLIPCSDSSMHLNWYHNNELIRLHDDERISWRYRTQYEFDYVSLDILCSRIEDSGVYMCKAANSLGQAATSCLVEVKSYDELSEEERESEFWYSQQTRHTEDTSLYQRHDSIEEYIRMKPRFLTTLEKDIVIPVDEKLTIEYRFQPIDDDNLRIEWFRNGAPLNIIQEPRYQSTKSLGVASLFINSCKLGDSGIYVCKLENEFGSAESQINLLVDQRDVDSFERKSTTTSLIMRKQSDGDVMEHDSKYEPKKSEKDRWVRFLTCLNNFEVKQNSIANLEAVLDVGRDVNPNEIEIQWFKNGLELKTVPQDKFKSTETIQLDKDTKYRTDYHLGRVSLEIVQVSPHDSGIYTCRVKILECETVTCCHVRCIPVFPAVSTDETSRMEARPSSSLIASTPLPKPTSTEPGIMSMSSITQHEEPQFIVPLSDLELDADENIHLQARVIPVELDSPSVDIPEDQVTSIHWFRDGIFLAADNRTRMSYAQGIVTFDMMKAQPRDSGTYTCKISTPRGQALSTASISIRDKKIPKKKMKQLSQTPEVSTGAESPKFTSKLKFTPPLRPSFNLSHIICRIRPPSDRDRSIRVEWYRNGQMIKMGTSDKEKFRSTLHRDCAVLHIRNADASDSGQYSVKVINSVGFCEDSITVQIPPTTDQGKPITTSEIPSFEVSLFNTMDAKVGEPLHLETIIKPANCICQWLFNDCLILDTETDISHVKTFHEDDRVSLHIDELTPTDLGIYTCKLIDEESGKVASVSCFVKTSESPVQIGLSPEEDTSPTMAHISNAPSFTIPLRTMRSINEGEKLTLDCRTDLLGPSEIVEWYLNGLPCELSPRHQVIYDMGYAQLEIDDVRPEDSGIYECKVHNRFGQAISCAMINVKPCTKIEEDLSKCPLFIQPLTSQDDNPEKGKTVPLVCTIKTDVKGQKKQDQTKIEWFYNLKAIDIGKFLFVKKELDHIFILGYA